jgi:sporulation protein YlmC with PRC-barrel domain
MKALSERAVKLAVIHALGLAALAAVAADPVRSADGRIQNRAHAAQGAPSSETAGTAAGTGETVREFEDIRATKLMGIVVRTPRGEPLGKVEDLVVDLGNARARYAVVEFEAPHFVQKKLFVYPIAALRPSIDGEFLELDVEKGTLAASPGFTGERWPGWSDEGYRRDLDARFGLTHEPDVGRADQRDGRTGRLIRASKVVGKPVKDVQGKDIGELVDLVVTIRTGGIRYTVVAFDKPWSIDDKLVAFPLRAFRLPLDRDELRVDVSRETIARAPGFTPRQWPMANINSNAWIGEVDRFAMTVIDPRSDRRSGRNARPLR